MVKPREVAVAIPVECTFSPPSAEDIRIWLVSSRKHADRFVLPKGGIERGESSRTAAVRELWEEAGLIGQPDPPSPDAAVSRATEGDLTVLDHKPHKDSPSKHFDEPGFVPRAKYIGHEVLIRGNEDVRTDWPEKQERERKTFTLKQAEKELAWRKDIHTIFLRWKAKVSTSA